MGDEEEVRDEDVPEGAVTEENLVSNQTPDPTDTEDDDE
jgi:hypothetical protein